MAVESPYESEWEWTVEKAAVMIGPRCELVYEALRSARVDPTTVQDLVAEHVACLMVAAALHLSGCEIEPTEDLIFQLTHAAYEGMKSRIRTLGVGA